MILFFIIECKGEVELKGLNKIVLNFVLPIVVLFLAFTFNFILGIIVVILFLAYMLFRSRSEIYANIGNVQYMKGKEDSAYNWIGKATETKDCRPNVMTAYAFLKLKRNEIEDAERLLNKVIDSSALLNDKNKAKTTMALVDWKKGRLYFAINNLEKIYDEYKNTNLYSYLGFLYIVKGDLEKALEFNREAYDYNSSNQFITNNLAYVNLLMENYEEAESLYMKLLEKTPKFLDPYYGYGLVKLNKGQKEEGLALLEKSLGYKSNLLSMVTTEEIKAKIGCLKENNK
jgi:tetratricopeptide (TPR) repeat protein